MPDWDPSDPLAPATYQGRPEPARARQALLDYLNLGPARNISNLAQSYALHPDPPTRSYDTLRVWSSRYNWTARAAAVDEQENRRIQTEYLAHRETVLKTGLARDHERIEYLTEMFKTLNSLIHDPEAMWIRQIKTVRSEDGRFERVELRRFNDDLYRILLQILQAIAAETGGRPRPLPQAPPASPAPILQDVSLDKLEPTEHAELHRLMSKIFS